MSSFLRGARRFRTSPRADFVRQVANPMPLTLETSDYSAQIVGLLPPAPDGLKRNVRMFRKSRLKAGCSQDWLPHSKCAAAATFGEVN